MILSKNAASLYATLCYWLTIAALPLYGQIPERPNSGVSIDGPGKLLILGNDYYGNSLLELDEFRRVPTKIASNIKEIDAAGNHSVLLKTDGTLLSSAKGYTNPIALNAVLVAAGEDRIIYRDADNVLMSVNTNPISEAVTTDELAFRTAETWDPAIGLVSKHSLSLKEDGTLVAFGSNRFGQVGDGTGAVPYRPAPIHIADGVVEVAGGSFFTLYLKDDGTLMAMGDNGEGQLGNGNVLHPRNSLIPIEIATNVKSIAAGSDHAFFITKNDILMAMGDNSYGQLGDGSLVGKHIPVQIADNVRSVAAGDKHSFYIKNDGTLMGMGRNLEGQLGDGTFINISTPKAIAANVIAAAAGDKHSLFITSDNTLMGVGRNDRGQRGSGLGWDSNTPMVVAHNVEAVSAGDEHSLFITSDAILMGMGNNSEGQLGLSTERSSDIYHQPQQIAIDVSAVSAGDEHSLYVTFDGSLVAMGSNQSGQLGDDTNIDRDAPVLIENNVIATEAGGYHSLFISADNELFGMGAQTSGQLGDGGEGSYSSPETVIANDVTAISVGQDHSLFLKEDGSLFGMGRNTSGQLGDRTISNRISPVLISENVKAVASGSNHSLYLKENGELMGMGSNRSGELGNSTTRSQLTPIQIDSNVKAISSGSDHSLYLKEDGNLFAMGSNILGQLGNGDLYDRVAPTFIADGVASISSGSAHSIFLKDNGDVFAMGSNRALQFGFELDVQDPLALIEASDIIAVAAGKEHSLALKSNGTLLSAGKNSSGQLGDGTFNDTAELLQVAIGVKAIAAGWDHSLFLNINGIVMGMGRSSSGQLGNDSLNGFPFDLNQSIEISTGVQSIAAAGNYSLLLKDNGDLMRTGSLIDLGRYGSPTRIAESVKTMAAGDQHYLYVREDGGLMTIGSNRNGQLGDSSPIGTVENRTVPVHIADDVVAVAAGAQHSLFLKRDGTLMAMGSNSHGQLGDGTTIGKRWPIQITNNVIAIAAASDFSLFLKEDNSLFGMGDNSSGQLGNGTYENQYSPILIAENVKGFAASNGHSLIIIDSPLSDQPNSQSIGANQSAMLRTRAIGDILGYQWYIGESGDTSSPIEGADAPNFITPPVIETQSYWVRIETEDGSIDSDAAVIALENETTRMINMSVLAQNEPSQGDMVAGFVVTGDQSLNALVRAIGPTLAGFGVEDPLPNPRLELFQTQVDGSGLLVANNDDWSSSTDAAEIAARASEAGAFELPQNSRDAALLLSLQPGAYTAKVTSSTGESGMVIVEIYDLDKQGASRLANMSFLGRTGDKGTAMGFVVEGSSPSAFLARAVGPELVDYGVAQALSDPSMRLNNVDGLLRSNDSWSAAYSAIQWASEQAGAFELKSQSDSAAMLIDLGAGIYTIQVNSSTQDQGTTLTELYDLSSN